ncbi:MAG TPA: hypothetical protein PKL08_01730 [Thermoanaerobaculaceae bacterium]|nr:hypothetical protein [Thermoanaerobaculaceae bacterium]
MIELRETSGSAVTLRLVPLDEISNPVDGGTIVELKPNERRFVRLAARLPLDDFAGRVLRVETISGSGQATVRAPWLAPAEVAAAASAAAHVPRRHLSESTGPSSEALIDQGEAAGTLDHETAVLYRVYAIFADARLPAAYRGEDRQVVDSVYLASVVSEFATYSAATQAALQPFLIPPAYQGSWVTPAASPGGVTVQSAFDPCDATGPSWQFKENPSGHVRVWYNDAVDSAQAAAYATVIDNTVWPKFASLLSPHVPKGDGGVRCSGGSDRLDVYIVDIARSYRSTLTSACTGTPAFICLRRTADIMVLTHELFHAFQFSYPVPACLGTADYRWWTEGSANWAVDYVFPHDQYEQRSAPALLMHPDLPLDYWDDSHVYGSYLLPFFLAHTLSDKSFVNKAWEDCAGVSAVYALDSVIPGGFARQWPDFVLHNWNYGPVDKYYEWDSLSYVPKEVVQPKAVVLDVANAKELEIDMDLQKLSASYTHYKFDDANVRSVAFWNGATYDLEEQQQPFIGGIWNPQDATPDAKKGVKVQALVKLRNQDWQVQNWTNTPYVTFCRDLTAERIDELVIIVSNSEFADPSRHAKPQGQNPRLFVSGLGCWQWKGSASWTETGATGTQTDVTQNVVWTRMEGQTPVPQVFYKPSGTVTVTVTGQCTGSKTVPIAGDVDLLETYNYLPQDNTASTFGYKGQAVETGMIPVTCQGVPGFTFIGSWFSVPPPNPPQFPFFKATAHGSRLNDFYSPTNGLRWQWDLQAQSEP